MDEKEERIQRALNIAWRYAQIDGSHHKMWAIDQMVRVLCGNEKKYVDWVKAYETPITEDDYYTWDIGIAP